MDNFETVEICILSIAVLEANKVILACMGMI